MELNRIKEGVSFLSGPTNLGVIETDDGAILIDSGMDDDTARRALNLLEKKVRAVINTHSHADHCGGNAFIKKRTDAQIFAPELESCFIEHPLLEPSYLYSAFPVRELRNKFFMAKPSKVDSTFEEGMISVMGRNIKMIALPGHSINHFGIEVDNVFFCGDAFLSESVLEKHSFPLYFNVGEEKETLNKLLSLKEEYYVPSHGKPGTSVYNTIKANIEKIEEIENAILQGIGKSAEEILSELIPASNPAEYFLCRASLMAFLSHMQECNKIECRMEKGKLIWTTP